MQVLGVRWVKTMQQETKLAIFAVVGIVFMTALVSFQQNPILFSQESTPMQAVTGNVYKQPMAYKIHGEIQSDGLKYTKYPNKRYHPRDNVYTIHYYNPAFRH